MTAPTNAPVVSSISLSGPAYLIGQTTNEYQPLKINTWSVAIPSVLLGNEARVGFAAFSTDAVHVYTAPASAALGLLQLVGVFTNQYYQEGNPGSLYYTTTMGSNFQAPVLCEGSIYAYNSGPIDPVLFLQGGPTSVLKAVATSTDPNYPVGSFFQGADPSLVVGVDVSSFMRPRTIGTVTSNVGSGFLLDVLKAA